MASLQSIRFTLNALHSGGDWTYFYAGYGSDEETVEELHLRTDIYNELGRPETITVTVESGDRLNGLG